MNGDLFTIWLWYGESPSKFHKCLAVQAKWQKSGRPSSPSQHLCEQLTESQSKGHTMSTESANDQDSWHVRHTVNKRQIISSKSHHPRPAVGNLKPTQFWEESG